MNFKIISCEFSLEISLFLNVYGCWAVGEIVSEGVSWCLMFLWFIVMEW